MVTEAGKELLRNTINTAKFHNRILEENEMWKQFELERGLTMMVSDDAILKKSKKHHHHHHHQCSKHRKQRELKTKEHIPKVISSNSAGPSNGIDRWDHNGFRELYPDEATSRHEKKWDHSGFLELYPEEAVSTTANSKSKEHQKKEKKKKRKHFEASTSDTEIWEEFKMYKRKKKVRRSKDTE